MRYCGTVADSMPRHNFGFITISGVTKEDGSPADLATREDIYIHQDNCSGHLTPGARVLFCVEADDRRGPNALRALSAVVESRELVLVGAGGQDIAIADPQSLYVPTTPRQQLAKFVPAEDVAAVIFNEPMPLVPRTAQSGQAVTKDEILARAFPQLYTLSQETDADFVAESFDAVIAEYVSTSQSLGFVTQAEHIVQQARVFKALRTNLVGVEELLTPGSILPIQYLPDLFMAVPVWYFWADENLKKDSQKIASESDPHVHQNLSFFCDQFPNQRWADTFLMFNRRIRTLSDYRGDIIPLRIFERMKNLSQYFDYLTIMTPYHDVAGKDWEDIKWLRSIDPYVVGFIKGVPMMFVLGRFSDSGVFPLHSELVADTINFLKQNKQKLAGFNLVSNPYWYASETGSRTLGVTNLGTHLQRHVDKLLKSFEEGYLFDWLRGSDQKLPATK